MHHVLLVANKPGSVVDTGLTQDENAISQPITSTYGFFNYYPKYIDIHADGYKSKISPGYTKKWALVNFTATDHNLLKESYTFIYDGPQNDPVGKSITYINIYEPTQPPCTWQIDAWIDGNPPEYPPDGILDVCDMIQVHQTAPVNDPRQIWLHIQAITTGPPFTLTVGQVLEAEKTILVDGQTYIGPVHEYEKPCHPIVETFTLNLTGKHVVTLQKHILTQWLLCKNNALQESPYYSHTLTANWPVYVTIKEDIAGAYYDTWHGTGLYGTTPKELVSPDCKVDLKDVYTAALAFGSYPGHSKWNTGADINGDYKVDLKDYFAIAGKFGW